MQLGLIEKDCLHHPQEQSQVTVAAAVMVRAAGLAVTDQHILQDKQHQSGVSAAPTSTTAPLLSTATALGHWQVQEDSEAAAIAC